MSMKKGEVKDTIPQSIYYKTEGGVTAYETKDPDILEIKKAEIIEEHEKMRKNSDKDLSSITAYRKAKEELGLSLDIDYVSPSQSFYITASSPEDAKSKLSYEKTKREECHNIKIDLDKMGFKAM